MMRRLTPVFWAIIALICSCANSLPSQSERTLLSVKERTHIGTAERSMFFAMFPKGPPRVT